MSGMRIGMLALLAIAFALWVFLAFRTLFRLRRRAVAAAGRPFPGPLSTLKAFRAFLTDPALIGDRRALGAATLTLFVSILMLATVP